MALLPRSFFRGELPCHGEGFFQPLQMESHRLLQFRLVRRISQGQKQVVHQYPQPPSKKQEVRTVPRHHRVRGIVCHQQLQQVLRPAGFLVFIQLAYQTDQCLAISQGCHNVMPARIVGGCLLLKHTDETASSEATGQRRIQQWKLSS